MKSVRNRRVLVNRAAVSQYAAILAVAFENWGHVRGMLLARTPPAYVARTALRVKVLFANSATDARDT